MYKENKILHVIFYMGWNAINQTKQKYVSTNYSLIYHLYPPPKKKQDLAINNLESLICH